MAAASLKDAWTLAGWLAGCPRGGLLDTGHAKLVQQLVRSAAAV